MYMSNIIQKRKLRHADTIQKKVESNIANTEKYKKIK